MTDPKPATNDILAKIRAKSSGTTSAASDTSPQASAPTMTPPEETPTAAKPPAAPASKPAGTADILAALRGAAKPAVSAATADNSVAAKKQGAAPASAPANVAGAAPKGSVDIMAAIRSKAGGGATAAAPPSAPKAAPSKTPAKSGESAASVTGMSPADMIRAARMGKAEAAESQPKPVLPSKPLGAKAGPAPVARAAKAEAGTRRNAVAEFCAWLFSPIVVAWTSFIATATVSGLATARFMMPNVLVEPPTRFKIGPPNDYAPGTVSTKWQSQFGIWVVNAEVDGQRLIYALSTVCTHLGCTPNWLEGEQKFKCPCHGSGFYKTGVNFEGPAPRPLERVGIRLAEDGMIEVDKSVKFQRELGQWTNSASFVAVT